MISDYLKQIHGIDDLSKLPVGKLEALTEWIVKPGVEA